jgi:hypothetical protein
MCLALARYEHNDIITESDVNEAIARVTGLLYASEKAASGGGLDPLAQQTKKVLDHLIVASENQLLRTDLLAKGWQDFDVMTLDKIVDTLLEMGWVTRQKVGIGMHADWLYKLAGEPKDKLMKFRAQRNGRLAKT